MLKLPASSADDCADIIPPQEQVTKDILLKIFSMPLLSDNESEDEAAEGSHRPSLPFSLVSPLGTDALSQSYIRTYTHTYARMYLHTYVRTYIVSAYHSPSDESLTNVTYTVIPTILHYLHYTYTVIPTIFHYLYYTYTVIPTIFNYLHYTYTVIPTILHYLHYTYTVIPTILHYTYTTLTL